MKFKTCILLLSVLLTASCNKHLQENAAQYDYVRIVFTYPGLGDRSYNDGIYRGFCKAELELDDEIMFESFTADSREETYNAILNWFEELKDNTDVARRLLIVSNSEYNSFFEEHPELSDIKCGDILILDEKEGLKAPWDNVYTRQASIYGASFYMGYSICDHDVDKAASIGANAHNNSIRDAINGFADGFKAAGGDYDDKRDTYYLGEDQDSGFLKEKEAYELCFSLADSKYGFVFPVCGGSSNGVMKYTRENPGRFYTCGIDKDMQSYSTSVAFSIVKDMGGLVYDFINAWHKGENLPLNENYLLGSKYVNIVISSRYENDYSHDDAIIEVAKEAETKFLGLK